MTNRVYLDWNATAPLRPQARAAMVAALDVLRQSFVGARAKAARRAIWSSRPAGQVAALVGAEPENVVFTSGGTEANALALTPLGRRDGAIGCWFRRSNIPRCWPAAASTRPGSGRSP